MCVILNLEARFYFCAHPVALGRIDHGDFTDSNLEDVGQPEIAIWPPKPKVSYISENMTDIIKISKANIAEIGLVSCGLVNIC